MAACYLAIATVSIFVFRVLTANASYSYVPGDIPVSTVPLGEEESDRREQGTLPTPQSPVLDSDTPVVVLTTEAFIFGTSAAFSDGLTNVRNKFQVQHVDGQPQIGPLLKTMTDWASAKQATSGLLIFAPVSEIPMPIVLQVMADIRAHSPYKRIILSGGII